MILLPSVKSSYIPNQAARKIINSRQHTDLLDRVLLIGRSLGHIPSHRMQNALLGPYLQNKDLTKSSELEARLSLKCNSHRQ